MLEVDGATGGGAILRISVPVAISLGEKLRITNIRGKRPTPGLRQQHLKGIELLAEITGSTLHGAKVGSTELVIESGSELKQETSLNIPTAGSVSLVYQLLSNYAVMSKNSVEVVFDGGGTHTKWSPNFDYLTNVTIPALQLFGQHGKVKMDKPGYYPKGGASGTLTIDQESGGEKVILDPVEGRPELHILSRATNSLRQAKVAERLLQGLMNQGIEPFYQQSIYDHANSTGCALTGWMVEPGKCYRGFSSLGEKRVKAEQVGEQVAKQLIAFNEPAAVDEYLADQLMLALTQSPSGSYYTIPKITDHVSSNLNLINSLLDSPLSINREKSYFVIQK